MLHKARAKMTSSRQSATLGGFALVAGLTVFLAVAGCGGQSALVGTGTPEGVPETGKVLPIDAEELKTLLERNRGRVVVINLWATWCPPCVVEMPELQKFHDRHADAGVFLAAVSADALETLETTVEPFVQKQGLTFPVFILKEVVPDELGKMLGAEFSGALPTTLVYTREGNLSKVWEGQIHLSDLENAVSPLL